MRTRMNIYGRFNVTSGIILIILKIFNDTFFTVFFNVNVIRSSSITGIKSKFDPPDDDHLETKMLSTILTLDSRKRHDILMHPLVQLFVQAKAKKYSNFIWASVIYHVRFFIWLFIYKFEIE